MQIRRKVLLVVVVVAALLFLSYGWDAWAMPLQNRLRQTVPTRTPRPATATPAPPLATPTPLPLPPRPQDTPVATQVPEPAVVPILPVTGE